MKTPAFHIFVIFAILISLLGSALTVTPVYAAGISVTTTSDEYNAGGDCSLREAITAANTNTPYGGCSVAAGADSITLPAGIYTLTITTAGEDANAGGDLDITQALTINGAGAVSTIIQAGAASGSGIDRVLDVVGAISVNISDVKIANGKCTSCYGGGIRNAGTLIIMNSTLSGSSATLSGGGISNTGTLTIMNSTFSGNSATYGGGIFNSSGTLAITNSTFSGNSIVGGLGGGINNTGGTLTITNSTFSGNTTNVDYAGAIFSDGTLHLKNTILANSGFSGDCYNSGTMVTDINNLIEINGYFGNYCGTPALTSDPELGPLADNGGPTQTFAILPNSPAFNAGDNTTCNTSPVSSFDQRGVNRPQGSQCDIGAYEYLYFYLYLPMIIR